MDPLKYEKYPIEGRHQYSLRLSPECPGTMIRPQARQWAYFSWLDFSRKRRLELVYKAMMCERTIMKLRKVRAFSAVISRAFDEDLFDFRFEDGRDSPSKRCWMARNMRSRTYKWKKWRWRWLRNVIRINMRYLSLSIPCKEALD